MIKAHDGRLKASHKHQVSGRNFSIRFFHHCLSTDISPFAMSPLKSAETIRIPLLVCSYSGHPQGGSDIIHI